MSLKEEAYKLAHTAECRLQIEASRPDRNLRFLVGHLLHYENLRLRIVEIEHHETSSKNTRTASSSQRRRDGVKGKNSGLQQSEVVAPYEAYGDEEEEVSDGEEGSWSGSSDDTIEDDGEDVEEEDEDAVEDDGFGFDDEEEGLGLQRFPSAAAQPPRQFHPPPSSLTTASAMTTSPPSSEDQEDSSATLGTKPTLTKSADSAIAFPSDEDPASASVSPCDEMKAAGLSISDEEALRKAIESGKESAEMLAAYEKVRRCRCHGKSADLPVFSGRVWELPAEQSEEKEGKRRVVAEVAAG